MQSRKCTKCDQEKPLNDFYHRVTARSPWCKDCESEYNRQKYLKRTGGKPSQWVHRLSDVDRIAETATCAACGPVRIKINRTTGKRKCYNQFRALDNERHRSYRKHKGPVCEKCGFIAEDKCQLDVDHIDGNHQNNSIENLQTLCANCHRLKTNRERQARRAKVAF